MADHSNATWQRDLAISYERMGVIEFESGDAEAAFASFEARLGIAKRMSAAAPGNIDWQFLHQVALNWAGDCQRARDDLSGALASYQASLAIASSLAAKESGHGRWQRALWNAYGKVGTTFYKMDKPKEAFGVFDQAIKSGKSPDPSYFYRSDNPSAAAEDFAAAINLQPSGAYSVIWLHFASARLGRSDADEFAANATALDGSKWPWPVVALFRGLAKPDDVRMSASAAEPAA